MAIKEVDIGKFEVAQEPDMLYCPSIQENVVLAALNRDTAYMLNAYGLDAEHFSNEAQEFLNRVALSDPDDLRVLIYGAGYDLNRPREQTSALRKAVEKTLRESDIDPNNIQEVRYTPNFKELSILLVPELGEYFIRESPINDHARWEYSESFDVDQ